MKIIGVMTENFALYYDLVKLLKERGKPFISLSFDDSIPANVGLIITSMDEQHKVRFKISKNFSICRTLSMMDFIYYNIFEPISIKIF